MTGLVEMFGGVPVRARVAAADVAARQTHPPVRPSSLAEFRALLAFAGCQRLGVSDLGREVLARFGDRFRVRLAPT
jgi:hypothetical protein